MKSPMILIERFFTNSGWLAIVLLSLYAAFLVYKMQDVTQTAKWRKRSWLAFSFVFFGQLILGLLGFENFLMTGKLHFPIPALIISGPIYRMQLSFMTILFLSTVVISGPAWCSQLCYFGSWDYWAASRGKPKRFIKKIWNYKFTFLMIFVFAALLLRFFMINISIVIALSAFAGVFGIFIILFFSTRKNKMVHCSTYCPVGSLVNILKHVNPFRMYIDNNCIECMKCVPYCKHNALNPETIRNRKPGLTCTYCGDCLQACESFSIKYRFFNLSPVAARNLWLVLTVSLHAIFMGLARI